MKYESLFAFITCRSTGRVIISKEFLKMRVSPHLSNSKISSLVIPFIDFSFFFYDKALEIIKKIGITDGKSKRYKLTDT